MNKNSFVSDVLFPKPLTNNEIINLFQKYKQGDNDSKQKIILHNLRLVSYITNWFISTNLDQNDLFQEGVIGLIKSVDKFDISKNIKFSSFARRCIKNEILMYIRRSKKHIFTSTTNEIEIIDYKNSEDDWVNNISKDYEKNMINDSLNHLSEREKEVVKKSYGIEFDKITQKKIAEELAISRSYVSRIVTKSKEKMKHYIETEYKNFEVENYSSVEFQKKYIKIKTNKN